MTQRFGAGVERSGINTANTAYFNLVGGTGQRLRIRQVVVNIGVAPSTAPILYLSRTTVRGTQASTLAGIALDPGDVVQAGTLDVCGTGASQPTFTNTARIATGSLAVTAGGAWIWQFFDAPLVVPATSANGMAVCNANASGATTGTWHCSFLWDE